MSFRIGSLILTPNSLLLPMALAFFVVLSFQGLFPRVADTRGRAYGAVLAACIGGFAGAWLYGWLASPDVADTLHAWLDLRFGSFGGYWGALAGAAGFAAITRQPVLRYADVFAPAILVGGAVARLGCVFTGCCRGVPVAPDWLFGVAVLRPWPVYDLAALLLTFYLVQVRRRASGPAGMTTGLALLVYGLLRFPLEFARDLEPALGRLTWGQWMALVQVVGGGMLLAWLRRAAPRD
ncbi:MAG: hypothetical protein GWP08_17155 [Nitrospiraceae bacterium]|nr:hypothetical protein [Nitrospiraceae bacterium]